MVFCYIKPETYVTTNALILPKNEIGIIIYVKKDLIKKYVFHQAIYE